MTMNIFKKSFFDLILVVVFFFIIITTLYFLSDGSEEMENFVVVKINDVDLNLEIADDEISRSRGLMFVDDLEDNKGMMFFFEDEDIRYFWMKNVLISLDMLFVSSDLEIVGILENVPPCKNENCDTYSIDYPSKYVIEVNGGWVDENNVEVGDSIEFIN